MAISATGSNVQCRVLGRRRGKCRMGDCGWNFTILGLKDADLRVESDAANRLCVRWLVAEIFTKRPKHQIQQDHIWGYTAITKKHHIYQVLKPLKMRTQRWWFHANWIRNGQDMGCAAIPICSPTQNIAIFGFEATRRQWEALLLLCTALGQPERTISARKRPECGKDQGR